MRKFIAGLTLIAALTTLVVVCRPDGRKAARPGLAPGITDPADRSEDDRRRLAVIVDEQRRLIAEADAYNRKKKDGEPFDQAALDAIEARLFELVRDYRAIVTGR